MIDVNWDDNAKAAVREFAEYVGQTKHCERYLERIVPEQTKTVADAVEGKKIDISEMRDGMTVKCVIADSGCYKVGSQYTVGRDKDGYFGPLNEKGLASFNHQAYSFELVEDGEQEGKKWTHEYGSANIKCRILATDGDECWVLTEYGNKVTEYTSSLKPIKPTISEDAVSKLRAYANWTAGQESGYVSELVEEFIATHDII